MNVGCQVPLSNTEIHCGLARAQAKSSHFQQAIVSIPIPAKVGASVSSSKAEEGLHEGTKHYRVETSVSELCANVF